jgi:hypothetical protein
VAIRARLERFGTCREHALDSRSVRPRIRLVSQDETQPATSWLLGEAGTLGTVLSMLALAGFVLAGLALRGS